jgi:hypothetical protein
LEGKELLCPECGWNINVITYTINKIVDINKAKAPLSALYVMRCVCEHCKCEWEYEKLD